MVIEFLKAWGVQAGAGTLLALAVFLILTGRLVSRSSAFEMRKPYELMAEQWKGAHDDLLVAHNLLTQQNNELLELARTSNRVLSALPLHQPQTPEPTPEAST